MSVLTGEHSLAFLVELISTVSVTKYEKNLFEWINKRKTLFECQWYLA